MKTCRQRKSTARGDFMYCKLFYYILCSESKPGTCDHIWRMWPMSRIQIYGSTASEPQPFCSCLVGNGLEGYASSDKQLQAAGRTADTISEYTPSFCNANGLTNSWRLISPIPAGAGAKTAAARHEDGHRRERTVAVRQGGIESSRCQVLEAFFFEATGHVV